MAEILIVDDDQSIASAFERFLRLEGHECRLASNAADAIRLVGEREPDLVMMDVRMPGTDGLEALAQMKRLRPSLQVVIMTAHGTSQTSIDAMRAGAFEYVTKPFDLDQLRSVIARVLASSPGHAGTAEPQEDVPEVTLVGDTPEMRELYKLIGTLAANDVPALLIGERGTGKELVASTIHRNSPRRDQPFLAVDCASVPADVLEAELAASSGGTLYLSEVEALPRAVQARLARLLDVPARSAVDAVPTGMRVIAGSESELTDRVRTGTFSLELLDVLGVITLRLPPLRSRLSDVPVLVKHLARRFGVELNRDIVGVEPQVIARFQDYQWPGNVQELASALKRAAIVSRGSMITLDQVEVSLQPTRPAARSDIESDLARVTRDALQERLVEMPTGAESAIYHDIVGFVETTLVREAMAITNGNQVKASALLGVNRATLRKKAVG